ncbi:MAG: hypothetical protein FWD34_07730 [Oscillospiraceae bacterium]|nr:hypothetical protein [Oscillospiraceae bacterium]
MKKITPLLLATAITLISITACDSVGNTSDTKETTTETSDINTTTEITEETTRENNFIVQEINIHTAINDYHVILNDMYPGFPPYEVQICNDFDYNNDGINDYIVAYAMYKQFALVVFESETCNILFETRVMMPFLLELIKMDIYVNEQNEILFRFSRRYQDVAASTIKVETIQIETERMCKVFEAAYSLDDEFLHAYDIYQTEEEYVFAYLELLKGYEFLGSMVFKA